MFEKITPEQAGISSNKIVEYIGILEKYGMVTHSLLMMKGDKIFAEAYWKPFHKNFRHRMYSQTKSFVGIAIGLLIDDGMLSLDDKIVDLFPEKIDCEQPAEMKGQTIRDMLTMTTVGQPEYWFTAGDPDRTHLYFQKRNQYRPTGTLWEYDSPGSQVLSSLVEKLSGKSLLKFLDERLFSHMGTFNTAQILKTPNGDSWGDSAMICTTRDIASFGRLLMNGGRWSGQQLISEDYVKSATSKVVDNRINAFSGVFTHGYGYQVWRTEQNGFAFVGMGHQLTICLPDKDLLFSITSDNQGNVSASQIIVNNFFNIIVSSMSEGVIDEDKEGIKQLDDFIGSLELMSVKGLEDSPWREQISGKIYKCAENPLGMQKFSFLFEDNHKGEFRYTNAQGDKVIPFGVNKNVFGKFPQLGYSNDVGGEKTTDGFMYDDAVSLCWLQDNRILMKVQIIDRYFGNFSAVFGFADKCVICHFEKNAEDFLNEYNGDFAAEEMIEVCE